MVERPILFSGAMVNALLRGDKTQTRRVIKPQPVGYVADVQVFAPNPGTGYLLQNADGKREVYRCPYGDAGACLWGRETWRELGSAQRDDGKIPTCGRTDQVVYAVDAPHDGPFRPSIFMPRWASRLTLEIVSVRVERVQDISEEDAIAEGVEPLFSAAKVVERPDLDCDPMPWTNYLWHGRHDITSKQVDSWDWQYSGYDTAKGSFSSLWESINAKRGYGWDANPFCWVIEFKRVNNEH